jgi:FkbM family methyltransferase
VTDRFGYRYSTPSLREPVAFHLLIDGSYEPDLTAFILSRLEPGDVFVDVGANIGCFTIPAAMKIGSSGQVLAAEASPSVFPHLKANVETNGLRDRVMLEVSAVAAEEGVVEFYPAPAEHFGMGSMAPQFSAKPVKIPAITLDALVVKKAVHTPKLIKVDVEGFETAVFKGAQKILAATPAPIVVFEFCDWAEDRSGLGDRGTAQKLLMESGYRIWRLHDYLHRRARLTAPLRKGFETLVALRDPRVN